MEDTGEKKGFTVRDRRISSQPEELPNKEKEKEKAEGIPKGREEEAKLHPLPEVNFSSFILSLSTSALLHLGEVPDPATQNREKNLPLAKQTIDILGMLQDKTKGNLAPDEDRMLETLLADLRWRYIREAKS